MKVFVQKIRIRSNLLLWRWCSKSLWIRFLLQIHHNFQVFAWKWGFDDISNDILNVFNKSGVFPSETRILLQKYLGVDNGSGNCWPICCENAYVEKKKVSDDTKRSFLGKKCCRIPDLFKKRQLLTISWVGFKIMIIRERVKLIIILGGGT